jgi:DNA repair protein RadC
MEATISNSPVRVGPRELLAQRGSSVLSDAELIAVVLGTGSTSAPVSVVAAQLLEHAGGLHGLSRLALCEIERQVGVGTTKAARLMAAFELGTRLATRPLARDRPIASSRDLDAALRPKLRNESREHFFAVPVDARNRPLALIEVAVGGLSACAVSPADIFREVLRHPAVGVLFAHNHPSGETVPSEEDALFTRRLIRAGELLGVQVLDHVILGYQSYFSFLDSGLVPGPEEPHTVP